jgi:hypothetical protein
MYSGAIPKGRLPPSDPNKRPIQDQLSLLKESTHSLTNNCQQFISLNSLSFIYKTQFKTNYHLSKSLHTVSPTILNSFTLLTLHHLSIKHNLDQLSLLKESTHSLINNSQQFISLNSSSFILSDQYKTNYHFSKSLLLASHQ